MRRKTGVWFFILVVIAVIVALMPTTIKSSLYNTVVTWVDSYNDAIEGDDHDNADTELESDDEELAEPLTVRMDEALSDYIGIATITLVANNYFPESKALAKVVDIRPLVALKTRYNRAVSALNVAKVAERTAAQELKRLSMLAEGVGSVRNKRKWHMHEVFGKKQRHHCRG
ncbi:MAG: hypothetical protein Q9N32_08120 [Gammaproteobacteria bacterium]|nr:hypothetical protein [Gammaproteobacteria bacterium]